MSENIKTKTLKIDGMTCVSCENRIKSKLISTLGVINAKVNYSYSTAIITYDNSIVSLEQIIKTIEALDYKVIREQTQNQNQNQNRNPNQNPNPAVAKKVDITKILGFGIIIFALYMVINYFNGFGIFNAFPQAEQGMGYGMLFVIGLFTSIHCMAMCGGINISQCVPQKSAPQPGGSKFTSLRPSILYNAGRVVSYTAIGALVGALGSAVSFSGAAKGLVQLAAGVFMVIMGVNMLNIFPWLRRFNPRMPKIFSKKINEQKSSKSPFYIGLLNGLMPCGPLQAMQLYALSTGDPFKGALSMFMFSLGTVPLMFGLGAVSTILTKKFKRRMISASAVLVVVLGVFMFSNGMSLSGISLPSFKNGTGSKAQGQYINAAVINDGVQTITTGLPSGRYEPITVQKGVPVKWNVRAESGEINGCNNAIVIPEFGKELQLKTGDNYIEFTPTETGTFGYSCWMGMIRSKITVVDSLAASSGAGSAASSDTSSATGGTDVADNTGLPNCCQ